MPAKIKLSTEEYAYLKSLYTTDYGTAELSKIAGRCYFSTIRPVWIAEYGELALKERAKRLCRFHKIGSKNPMFGKSGLAHHNSVEVAIDSSGYRTVFKPDWYTQTNDSRMLEHIFVYLSANNMTIMPKGFVIHHIDFNKENNNLDNLVMLSISDHMKLHSNFRKGATTRSKDRTPQESGEARDNQLDYVRCALTVYG